MRRFPSSTALFYTAEVGSVLVYLHSLNIIYRDIKLENLLLDREGHLKIVDFGFSKQVRDKTRTLCGTPEYIAPEIILNMGYGASVDWWAMGVLVFEMVVGYPPFQDRNMLDLYNRFWREMSSSQVI
jgi:serine/threonine protein kinase